MEMPSSEVLIEAVELLAATCQADMKVLFVHAADPEDVKAARDANTAWEEFVERHPELNEYLNLISKSL